MVEVLLLLAWIRPEVFVVCHSLAEARGNTMQDDVYQVVDKHPGIDIQSIDIYQVFRYSTCLFQNTDLVKSPAWLVIITIVLSSCDCNS